MTKKYHEIYELPVGIGRELRIKKSIDNDSKMIFYLTVDEKFSTDEYYTKRLKPEAAKEIIINQLPTQITKWEKGKNIILEKSSILAECFNISLQDYGGQGWNHSEEEGKFELTYGYGNNQKVEIFHNKKEAKKKYNSLNTEAAVWDKSSIIPELVTAKNYSKIL